jgi:hypothetical protein
LSLVTKNRRIITQSKDRFAQRLATPYVGKGDPNAPVESQSRTWRVVSFGGASRANRNARQVL